MSETPAPYRVGSVLLDPCIRREQLPTRPDFSVGAQGISDDRRGRAHAVVEAAHLDIAHHLSTAPEAWTCDGRRTVRLWDLVEFSVAEDGTDLQVRYLRQVPDMSCCLVRADFSQPIGRFAWPAVMEPVLAPLLSLVGLNMKVLPGNFGMYIHGVLCRTFRNYVDWKRLRRSVLKYLQLDPLVVSLTRRTFDGGIASFESFNWVAANVRELALVATEHPRLLPFLQMVSGHDGSPIHNFECAMQKAGLRPTAFRKLERWGYGVFSAATEWGLVEDSHALMADFANLLDRLGVQEDPPAMLAELAVRGVGTNAPDWYLRALWKEIEALAKEEPDDAYPPDFELTAAWLASSPPEPDDNQKQAGWPWIVDQAWTYRIATDAAAHVPWGVPCDGISVDGHDVIPIRSLVELRDEAEAMHNCLMSLEGDCRAGNVVVFSIRKDGRRLASFTAERKPDLWKAVEIAGKLNRAVPEEIKAIALRATDRLNKRRES